MPEVYDSLCKKYNIDICEAIEIYNYIRDFEENGFVNLNELNNYLTDNDEWEYYPTIRSLNTHGSYSDVPGIQPIHHSIVSKELNLKAGNGHKLDSYKRY